MVDRKVEAKLQEYGEQILNLNEEREELLKRRSVEVFFSFDIVNSSSYKTLNFTGWAQVIIALFSKIQQMVAKKMPSAELWKILGDEVIFIVPIREKQDIFPAFHTRCHLCADIFFCNIVRAVEILQIQMTRVPLTNSSRL